MQRSTTLRALTLAGLLAPAAMIPAHATAANADVSAGDWLLRGGLTHVAPKSDNGNLPGLGNASVDVGSNTRPSGNITYMMTDNLGLELLVAIPFKHDISIDGLGNVGSTRHLPPTLSLQYHFNTGTAVRPYVGAGINYTHFFDEDTADVTGQDIDLDDSWGAAVQAGIDFAVDENWFVNAEVRWIDIETDVSLGTADLGTVKIDPWTFGMNVGYRF
ncbi:MULTISPECIES: OmpW family protein [unclassified Thioalkalivibrio]|uniref:OmpW/AlkL family protein n=1 Tax=unclassified Thioalkalivibrio TaxID=2621013 RepID=UPI00037D828E|nr:MULTISPECIES: OmpW family outer membrane protein [unclassified Thioalkalivibrio]